MWVSGTIEKSPELSTPLYVLWMAVQSSLWDQREVTFRARWRKLERERQRAIKTGDNEREVKIEEEMQRLADYATPVTVGHLKELLSDLKKRTSHAT